MEETLLIIKPDIVETLQVGSIINMLSIANFNIIEVNIFNFNNNLLDIFYKEHINKLFYNKLKNFMLSGRCWFVLLQKINAIEDLRLLIGHTNSNLANEHTIRGTFGNKIDLERNAVHASDSLESFNFEKKLLLDYFKTIYMKNNICNNKDCK